MKQVLVSMRPKDGDSLDRNGTIVGTSGAGEKQPSGVGRSAGGGWLNKARPTVLVSIWSCLDAALCSLLPPAASASD